MGLRCVYVTCNISAQVTRTSARQVSRCGGGVEGGSGDRYSDTFSTQVTHKANKSAMFAAAKGDLEILFRQCGKGKGKGINRQKGEEKEQGIKQTYRQSFI